MKFRIAAGAIALGVGILFQPALAQTKMTMFYPSPLDPATEKFFIDFTKKIEADSKGTLSLDLKSNSPVANFGNIIDRVENDVVQIGVGLMTVFAGRFQKTNVVTLPFVVDLNDDDQASAALWRLYKTGALASEWQSIIPLFIGVSKQSGFHFAKDPGGMDKLTGLKIRIFNPPQVEFVKALGMSPVSMPPTDMYTSLQRGTLDAVITAWSTFPVYKLHEVTKHHVELPLGGSPLIAFMAKKKYDSLPAEAKAAIDASANEANSRIFGKLLRGDADRGKAAAVAAGNTVTQLPPAILADWQKRYGDPWIDGWKTANGAEGVKALDEFKRIYADVMAGK